MTVSARALENLTIILDDITAGNLPSGHSLGLEINDGKRQGTIEITGKWLEEGLGFGTNLTGKLRALEAALRDELHLPEPSKVELLLPPEKRRLIVLPSAALEKLSELNPLKAEIIGEAIKIRPEVVAAFKEKSATAIS